MNRIERLTEALQALQPSQLEIIDDSHHHAGHAAMKGITGQHTHLHIRLASPQFADKPRLQQHRMVQSLCKAEMETGLHALQITVL